MNKQAKTITALVVLCGLLVLSTGYVVQLQSWLVFNLNIENSKQKQLVTGVSGYTGIRTLVSSEELVTYSAKEAGTSQLDHKLVAVVKTPTPVLNQVFNPPASNLLATGTVLPKDRIDTSESLAIEPKTIEQTWSSKVFNQQKEFPLVVELDDEVIIEFSENYSRLEMQKAISRLLVLSNSIDAEQILSSKAIDTHQKPYLYKRVFNEYAKPIRYPAQAFRYAELLINNHAQQIHDEQGVYTVVSIPLTEQQLPTPVETYRAWVNQYAQQHQVSPELVFAIMDVESAFNPRAVSQSNALGLMQIKSNAAGRDVYQLIDKKAGKPSKSDLFNPQENIRIGVAYMGLLNNEYLKRVRNKKNREMLLISSYNGGLSKALKLFAANPNKAIQRINQLHPKNIYRTLRYQHPSDETKRYLDKVLNAKTRYQSLLS